MKIVLIGANGKIGELVQKALAGAGHEIVKVGHKSARRRSVGAMPLFFSQRPKSLAWWTSQAAR